MSTPAISEASQSKLDELWKAIEAKDHDLFQQLLSAPDMDSTLLTYEYKDGKTPWKKGFFYGDPDMEEKRKEYWVPTPLYPGGKTLLMKVAYEGHCEMAMTLLAMGASVNHTNEDGETALMWATNGGYLAMVTLLLNNGADPMIQIKTYSKGITATAYLDDMDPTKIENPEIMRALLATGMDPNQTDQSEWNLLHYYVNQSSNLLTYIQTKQQQGEDATRAKQQLLISVRVVMTLLSAYADTNLSNFITEHTPLMIAKHPLLIKMLLKAGAHLECQDAQGDTALLCMIQRNEVEAVKVLLEAGANPNHRNKRGFHGRMMTSHPEILALLHEKGVRITYQEQLVKQDHETWNAYWNCMAKEYLEEMRAEISAMRELSAKNQTDVKIEPSQTS